MNRSTGSFDLESDIRGNRDHPEAVLRVIGEFDRLRVERFDRETRELSQSLARLTVDLTQTTIIDSSALGSLVRLRYALDDIGCDLEVVVSNGFQATVMKVGGLREFLSVTEVPEPEAPDAEA